MPQVTEQLDQVLVFQVAHSATHFRDRVSLVEVTHWFSSIVFDPILQNEARVCSPRPHDTEH